MKTIVGKNGILSYSSAALLKIVFEVMVLIHHLYHPYTAFGAEFIRAFGPISVGGFVFLSGYGVGTRFIQEEDEYAKRLLKNRIPKTYAILFVVNICYLILYLATGGEFDNIFSAVISVLYLPVFSGFVALSHYIYFLADLIIYYLMFLLFVYLFKKSKNRLLCTALSILIVGLIIIAVLSVINANTGSTRFLRGCLCFPIGILCAIFSEKLSEILKKYKIWVVIALSSINLAIYEFLNYRPSDEYVLPIFIALTLVALLYGVNTENKAVRYLSNLVIYVYVSHEFFINIFNIATPSLHRNIIGLLVLACSATVAVLLNHILRKHCRFVPFAKASPHIGESNRAK